MRRSILILALALAGCNDLTEPLPNLAGSFDYVSFSSEFVSLNRRGTLTIVDSDRRTARFEGNYEYTVGNAAPFRGQLIGAFVTPDRIWFRFLDERAVFHEADLGLLLGNGDIYFLGATYEPSGATFSLRRR
ncbi:MAG: hypothetical protein WEE89_19920 [Gemmatimonadota bacterium]